MWLDPYMVTEMWYILFMYSLIGTIHNNPCKNLISQNSVINHFDPLTDWFFYGPPCYRISTLSCSPLLHLQSCQTQNNQSQTPTSLLYNYKKLLLTLFLPVVPLVLLSCITSNVTWIGLFIKIKHCEHHEMCFWSIELKMDHWVHTFDKWYVGMFWYI